MRYPLPSGPATDLGRPGRRPWLICAAVVRRQRVANSPAEGRPIGQPAEGQGRAIRAETRTDEVSDRCAPQ